MRQVMDFTSYFRVHIQEETTGDFAMNDDHIRPPDQVFGDDSTEKTGFLFMRCPIVHGPYEFLAIKPDDTQNHHFSEKTSQCTQKTAVVDIFKPVEMDQLDGLEVLPIR